MTIPLGNSQRLRLNLEVQSLIFVSWVFLSTEKPYSSFPRLKNLELHGLNPRPLLYSTSAKNHLNCLQNLLFESLFLWVFVAIFGCGKFLISGFHLTINKCVFDRQSAKTADWLVDNDVIWPVLRNCACANLGKLKIEHGGWAWESDAKLQGPTRLLFVEKEIIKYSKKP